MPIFGWNVALVSLIFLKRSLVFPILLFSSISLHLLFFGTLHSDAYIFPFLFVFTSLLFTAIFKAFLDNHFAFLHLFFFWMVLIPASCTMSWTSVHSSSGTVSDLTPCIYFSLSLYNPKGFSRNVKMIMIFYHKSNFYLCMELFLMGLFCPMLCTLIYLPQRYVVLMSSRTHLCTFLLFKIIVYFWLVDIDGNSVINMWSYIENQTQTKIYWVLIRVNW